MDKVLLGAEAETIKNNIAFKRAQDTIEKTLVRKLREIPIDGKAETERYKDKLLMLLKMSDYYNAAFKELITTGKLEEHRFNQKKAFSKGGI
jgi:hypothetical protein